MDEDDIEEDIAEGLDPVAIVTKRIVFEQVDLLPRLENEPILAEDPDEPQIFNNSHRARTQVSAIDEGDEEVLEEEEEEEEREHGLISIHRAAQYAAGVKRVPLIVTKNPSKPRAPRKSTQEKSREAAAAAEGTSPIPSTGKLSVLQSTAPEAVAKKVAATRIRKKNVAHTISAEAGDAVGSSSSSSAAALPPTSVSITTLPRLEDRIMKTISAAEAATSSSSGGSSSNNDNDGAGGSRSGGDRGKGKGYPPSQDDNSMDLS